MIDSRVNVLLVGSGGREHALAWKLLKSPHLERLYIAPGNGGTTEFNVPIKSTDIDSLVAFAKEKNCFTIVGPEVPLELGLIDALNDLGLPSFGPTKEQAKLETSKAYAKEIMVASRIPTGRYRVFSEFDSALDFSKSFEGNVVVKADGLAAGKGVYICSSMAEAEDALKKILIDKILGRAGDSVVIEEKLEGYEVSLMAICDGRDALLFGTAMDHKRLLDNDRGPNTGGMGAFSPASRFDESQSAEVMDRIIRPVVIKSGFKGFLYAGLMVTKEGPKVLEFNARLGDPETQCLVPRLRSDLLKVILDFDSSNELTKPEWESIRSSCVVMCSKGYPGTVETGFQISGLQAARNMDDVLIFHAGTKELGKGQFRTAGGRVICVCATGKDLAAASQKAYSAVNLISWSGEYHRTDIGSGVR